MIRARHSIGGQRGFTLIEVLMATAVLALVAGAIYVRTGDVQNQTMIMERRAFGQWLAADALTEVRLAAELAGEPPVPGSNSKHLLMAGRDWRVHTQVENTNHPALFRVEIEVSQETAGDDLFAGSLVGFVGVH